ncbi:Fur family transcriptional regulator [Leucobacter chromiireducens]|uniref:Transcriptional repressor n=1 Tax=Leucobacter chromiireducens subsp. solipictus TaxID=398235 RepID=A0ABS1SE26_9MICO|nr:Fur family transcriptional regulator [Leucobacter chromiireducens]MBL3678710.1 transcriptional repressor [Leucobacter chromiireducens subsp. solipictus]
MTPRAPRSATDAQLSSAGLRSTAPRRAVLEMLEPGGHLDASGVYERLRTTLPGTSLQAVYGVLGALTDAGLVRRVAHDGGPAHYEARVDNHHHLVCRSCGRIEDVPCVIGRAPCLTPAEDHGFTVDTAEITFYGVCAACTAASQ